MTRSKPRDMGKIMMRVNLSLAVMCGLGIVTVTILGLTSRFTTGNIATIIAFVCSGFVLVSGYVREVKSRKERRENPGRYAID